MTEETKMNQGIGTGDETTPTQTDDRAGFGMSLSELLSADVAQPLLWSRVLELVGRIGKVEHDGEQEFVFTVGGKRGHFKRPHADDQQFYEVGALQKFLQKATAKATSQIQPARMIVIIDHHAARIYGQPGNPRAKSLEPYDPFGFHRHLIHRKEAHYQGDRVPEEDSFFQDIVEQLRTADQIFLVGHGTGKSNASDALMTYMQIHHPEVASRVVATESLDLSALTDAEIEREAQRRLG